MYALMRLAAASAWEIFGPIPVLVTRLNPLEVAVARGLLGPKEGCVQIVLRCGRRLDGGVFEPFVGLGVAVLIVAIFVLGTSSRMF